MPGSSKRVRGSDKRQRHRSSKAEIAKSKRKARSEIGASSASLRAFLGGSATEGDKVELNSAQNPEVQFTERAVVENATGGAGDIDSDDEDYGFDEDGDYVDEDSDCPADSGSDGWMLVYLSSIQERLKEEIREHFKKDEVHILDADKWLVATLRQHGWIIPWQLAPTICLKLKIKHGEPAYYCTVHVWLPEVRFKGETPHCGFCKSNARVGRHGFDAKHPARRITGLKKDEYIMAARYICQNCKEAKRQHYTFRGYNPPSLNLMACRRKLLFPALLTHRSGVTMELLHLIRSLVAAGVRPTCISGMIAEMQHRECHEQMLLAEAARQASIGFQRPSLFSEFDDPTGYNGRGVSSKYIQSVYVKFVHSFRQQADADTKKRDLDVLFIDASYKFTKHLVKVGGEKLFDGLITVKNNFKEIRSQFVIFGESHDQIRPPLEAMKATMDSHGQTGPKLAFTDNPRRDTEMLVSTFDSLAKTQEAYDAIADEENAQRKSISTPSTLMRSAWRLLQPQQHPISSISKYKYSVLRSDDEITMFAGNAVDLMKERAPNKQVIGLDLEWPVEYNDNGRLGRQGRVATIQLAYHSCAEGPENDICAAVIIVKGGPASRIPSVLKQLLCHKTAKFVGVKVSGDVKKLRRDFINMKDASISHIDLESMAKRRGVVPRNGTFSLVSLVEERLHESMEKEEQLSDWSRPLRTKQLDYAALDAIKSLEVYDSLEDLPDLTLELPCSDIIVGTKVDIVASKGSMATLAALCAEGEIVSQSRPWTSPQEFTYSKGSHCVPGGRHVLVRISHVFANGLIMQGYKNGRARVSLGDLVKVYGEGSFELMVDRGQLRHQYAQRRSSVSPGITERTFRLNQHPDTEAEADQGSRPSLETQDRVALDFTLEADNLLVHDSLFETGELDKTVFHDEIDSEDADEPFSELTPASIREINNVIDCALDKSASPVSVPAEVKLDPPPSTFIPTRYSVVLGDILHAIMRMRVPTKHECRKPYSAAIVRAFLEWDPKRLHDVKTSLIGLGVTEPEIEARLYYNISWFAARIERRALPSHLLYWRVWSVLIYFGPKIDSVSKKTLFGNNEWKKANNLLSEILKGYYSDPPGVSFYRYRLDGCGNILRDRGGFALLTCSRGTNDVENEHKNLLGPIGNWCMGIEVMDCLMADLRVRRNTISSAKYRPGFPNFRHYDPWLVDAIQNVVEKVHGILLYPNWTNSSDLLETPEQLGFVRLPMTDLSNAINIQAAKLDTLCLSRDMKYAAGCIGTTLPYQPFSGVHEFRLYPKLRIAVMRKGGTMKGNEFEMAMCFEIIPYIDGVGIFPKIPVYIRQMEKRYLERKRIGAAVESMGNTLDALNHLNAVTAAMAMEAASTANDMDHGEHDEGSGNVERERVLCLPPLLPRPNIGVCGRMIRQQGAALAGNVIIRELEQVEFSRHKKRLRSNDKVKRKVRHCRKCKRPQHQCPAAGSSKSGKIKCTYKSGDIIQQTLI